MINFLINLKNKKNLNLRNGETSINIIGKPVIKFEFKNKTIKFFGEIYYLNYKNKKISIKEKNFKSGLKKIILMKNLLKLNDYIEGSYFFLIEFKNNTFQIGRDKNGEKEIFYFKNSKKILISNNIKEIIKHISSSEIKNYNNLAIFNILSVYGNYSLKKETIYKNINRLGIDESLKVYKSKIKILKKKFIPLNIEKYNNKDLRVYFEKLNDSIRLRSSNGTNWIFMSSGWDSSSILSILNKFCNKKNIKAVVGRIKYSDKNGVVNKPEIERAKKICKYFGISLSVVNIDYTSKKFLKNFSKFKNFMKDNHMYCFSAYIYFELSNFINKNKTSINDVVFNGDISDGAHNFGFSQYANFLQHQDINFREYVDKMLSYLYGPSFIKKIYNNDYQKDAIYNFIMKEKNIETNIKNISKTKNFKFNYLAPLFIGQNRVPFEKLIISNLINERSKKKYIKLIINNYFKEILDQINHKNIYSCILHLYNSFHWQSGLVRATISSPNFFDMRGITPFRDSAILNFLSKMPEKWGRGLSLNETKYPLKYSLKNFIKYPEHLQVGPHSYLYDTDQNWNVFQDIIYNSNLNKIFKKNLKLKKIDSILDSKVFNLKKINRLRSRFYKNKIEKGKNLVELFSLISISEIGWY